MPSSPKRRRAAAAANTKRVNDAAAAAALVIHQRTLTKKAAADFIKCILLPFIAMLPGMLMTFDRASLEDVEGLKEAAMVLLITASALIKNDRVDASVKPRSRQNFELMLEWQREDDFKGVFRVSRDLFDTIVEGVSLDIRDNKCFVTEKNVTARFKVGVALYYFGHGVDFVVLGHVAGIGTSTAKKYVRDVSKSIVRRLGPQYVKSDFTEAELDVLRKGFRDRRGIDGAVLAVDGTHVPIWPPDLIYKNDYRNYKGWYSLNVLAYVTCFYTFATAEIGHPGRCCDISIFRNCPLGEQILSDPASVLGVGNFVLGDGGFVLSEGVMTPYSNPQNKKQKYFNFCFSSTRFFVEQAFGIWKER